MPEPIRKRRTITAHLAAARLQVTPRTIQNYQAEERAEYEARAKSRRQRAHELYEQGLSWAEVAKAMNCSPEAAKQLGKRFRAMQEAVSSV